jgi:diaminohydroxyphosphoribosylaminopyrimidine deaminase/5-amino-6-(5-phosphoribosylamino)uracil reductase
MYVTLEPCCHHGKTPPCTDAILNAGLKRVVVGIVDPFPAVAGKGIAALVDAGVDVRVGVLSETCEAVMCGFLRVTTGGLPEVSLKTAVSLDGRIATSAGESQWITGPEARAHGHGLRSQHDVILVGIGTAIADDPRLTCRTEEGVDPVPVLLDSNLRVPADARLFHGPRRAVIFCREDAPDRVLPADIVRVPHTTQGLDLREVLRHLASRGHLRVLVEGGARVHRSFLDAKLADALYVYLAGLVIPGGKSWVAGTPLDSLSDAVRWGAPDISVLGQDVLLHYGAVASTHD